MNLLPFKESASLSIGTELELQLINPRTYSLISRAPSIMSNLDEIKYTNRIKPEITQGMIELNSDIHRSPQAMLDELIEMQQFLFSKRELLNVAFSGGGTHPFQKWSLQKIYPYPRYLQISEKYGFLSKRATVFGQHIHIGCENPDDAIYLTHAMSRYVPQFIVMTASSPYDQKVNSGFDSCRLANFSAFPLSGVMPVFSNWKEFTAYFSRMRDLGIVETMKDFYWDIRPKPEFGTIEIRVFDMPLTIKHAVNVVAYVQALASYLLTERPIKIHPELYYLYGYNRFQACRYGFDGEFIHPTTLKRTTIYEDILTTYNEIKDHIEKFNSKNHINELIQDVKIKQNDAKRIRKWYDELKSFRKLMKFQCDIFEKNGY